MNWVNCPCVTTGSSAGSRTKTASSGIPKRVGKDRNGNPLPLAQDNAETQRLRDEVIRLRDRLEVLERITVEKENSLAREIENLRDR